MVVAAIPDRSLSSWTAKLRAPRSEAAAFGASRMLTNRARTVVVKARLVSHAPKSALLSARLVSLT
jgi:hypothetical protein